MEGVGIATGAKSFTTAPFIFTSYTTAKSISPLIKPDETVFGLVRVVPGTDPKEVAEQIRQRVGFVDVYTKEEYSEKTKPY